MKKIICTLFIILSICYTAIVAESTELKAAKTQKNDPPSLGVTFRAVNAPDLAGIKLVLHYDTRALKYTSLTKSKETQPMMHVVNDKTPGTLIVVMASASGQESPDFDLFRIDFDRLTVPGKQTPVEIKVNSVEMMSAALVEIPCSPSTFRLE